VGRLPALGASAKAELLAELSLSSAGSGRRRGFPALGSGTIYPVPEGGIRCAPFGIPEHWPRCFGLDTDAGAGWTACVWLAWDREANVGYVYDCFKRSHAEPAVND